MELPSLKKISESLWNAGEAWQQQIQNSNCAFIMERNGSNTPSKKKSFLKDDYSKAHQDQEQEESNVGAAFSSFPITVVLIFGTAVACYSSPTAEI